MLSRRFAVYLHGPTLTGSIIISRHLHCCTDQLSSADEAGITPTSTSMSAFEGDVAPFNLELSRAGGAARAAALGEGFAAESP